jgi:hypothetical protein
MNIKCLAENYVVRESGDSHFVYNEIYEGSTKFIFLAALLGIFYPDASEYNIPVCIELKNCDGTITIGKKLEVIGNADATCFIAKHQYQKWKKISLLVGIIATCMMVILYVYDIFPK